MGKQILNVNLNVNVYVEVPHEFSRVYNLHPWVHECPLGGATFDALRCSLYWLFVSAISGVALSPPGTSAGLRHDRRMVFALDHKSHDLN